MKNFIRSREKLKERLLCSVLFLLNIGFFLNMSNVLLVFFGFLPVLEVFVVSWFVRLRFAAFAFFLLALFLLQYVITLFLLVINTYNLSIFKSHSSFVLTGISLSSSLVGRFGGHKQSIKIIKNIPKRRPNMMVTITNKVRTAQTG